MNDAAFAALLTVAVLVVPSVAVVLFCLKDLYKDYKNRCASTASAYQMLKDEKARRVSTQAENDYLQDKIDAMEENFISINQNCKRLAQQNDDLQKETAEAKKKLERLETASGTLKQIEQQAFDALENIRHLAEMCNIVVDRPLTTHKED